MLGGDDDSREVLAKLFRHEVRPRSRPHMRPTTTNTPRRRCRRGPGELHVLLSARPASDCRTHGWQTEMRLARRCGQTELSVGQSCGTP